MEYFRPFFIPILQNIQEESLNYLNSIDLTNMRGLVADPLSFPILTNYLSTLTNKPLLKDRPFKFYITPPYSDLPPHVDFINRTIISLNIPIINTKDTLFYYVNCDSDNIKYVKSSDTGIGPAKTVKDLKKVNLIDSTDLTVPHLVRTDKFHGVSNPTNLTRIILSVRWENPETNFDKFFKD